MTEQKRDVATEVALLNQKLDNFIQMYDKRQQEHHHTLYGNGKEGLVMDVDRLKQAHDGYRAKARKHTGILYAAAASALGTWGATALGWIRIGK